MISLPIDDVLPQLVQAVLQKGVAVLEAPPGAGKTTRVPLALLDAGIPGRIVMLEPRRIAARAAAERMAQTLGEKPGERVGYRIRGESRIGRDTRIEVVTEGILTRMLQDDPSLEGVGAILFDEFHERSLNSDLGLALALEVRALRDDLRLVAMSATLDTEALTALMDAPLIRSEGRMFPVETRWLERPATGGRAYASEMAALIETALAQSEGGVLAFLPGAGEIDAVARALRLPEGVTVQPLYGALPFARQQEAIRPLATGRKLVLATAIAETSLTIEDIRIVVDGGRARRSRFDPGSGMARLVTEKVSRAEADQRRGRAGRVGPGVCYRLWTRGEEGGLLPYAPPEIAAADLASLALDLALWGASPEELAFLTPPPERAYAEARDLLTSLGALDGGRITSHGQAMARIPAHPRLAHMLLTGGGAELAALLEERELVRGTSGHPPVDLDLRLQTLRDARRVEAERPVTVSRAVLGRIRAETKRLARHASSSDLSPASLAALAYPDRIALRRAGDEPRYLLSGGAGAKLPPADPMAKERLLVALDLDGDTREALIRLAAPISMSELRKLYGGRFEEFELCEWSRRERVVTARLQLRFGALVLEDRHWREVPPERMASAAVDGVRDLGLEALGWSKASRFLRARAQWLASRGASLPAMDDHSLVADLEEWLQPYLTGIRDAAGIARLDPLEALKARLGWEGMDQLDRLAPAEIRAPTGTRLLLDYSGETPRAEVRLQEMFGVTEHPAVGPDRVPVLLDLLSPARRPVQTTADLPGFWQNSYADVRRELRGRYIKHAWPENPQEAPPTTRIKRKE